MDDPIKELVRKYDSRVVAKGGASIFGPHVFDMPYPGAPDLDGKSAPTRHTRFGTAWLNRRPFRDFPENGVANWAVSSEFDEM